MRHIHIVARELKSCARKRENILYFYKVSCSKIKNIKYIYMYMKIRFLPGFLFNLNCHLYDHPRIPRKP